MKRQSRKKREVWEEKLFICVVKKIGDCREVRVNCDDDDDCNLHRNV